jgi:hypothetical protein
MVFPLWASLLERAVDVTDGVYWGKVVESTAVVDAPLTVAVPSSTVKYVPAMAVVRPESALYWVKLGCESEAFYGKLNS